MAIARRDERSAEPNSSLRTWASRRPLSSSADATPCCISRPAEMETPSRSRYRSPDSELGDGDLSALAAAASGRLRHREAEASGVDSSALGALEGGFTTRVYGWRNTPQREDMESRMAVTYAYTMAVMFLCVFSSSFIVRSVVEEKASKLVEVLMLSVRPLALILGKILAMAVTAFSTYRDGGPCVPVIFRHALVP